MSIALNLRKLYLLFFFFLNLQGPMCLAKAEFFSEKIRILNTMESHTSVFGINFVVTMDLIQNILLL